MNHREKPTREEILKAHVPTLGPEDMRSRAERMVERMWFVPARGTQAWDVMRTICEVELRHRDAALVRAGSMGRKPQSPPE